MLSSRLASCRNLQLNWRCRRSLFTLPDLSSFSPLGTRSPQKYSESKRLPFTQKELYDVVSDVGSYPRFLPFCTGSRIISAVPKLSSPGKHVLDAELSVGFLAFKETYVSQVTCVPYQSVEAVATSSTPLFKTLSTIWRFEPSPTDTDASPSTNVSLNLVYAFANPLHAAVSSRFFGQVSELMIKAFEDRCREIYGRGQ
ncbi:hypothetical protein FA15DRAFT_664829 [Coprinopsis marcescibilis]|uniref:Coenzyme Q-binding protein COQ10 START domain-containing protein n=1 Tax=Coprinopsis marcescibilis TaxID=230819 RepID=A0A5C3L7W2_COPMA|nr:hypothetical protein FA15DRAFT_664829 [Coprinopsis marcescibilis]